MAAAVTATQGGSAANGMLLRVFVLTGAAAAQNGATFTGLLTGTSFTGSITTAAGSNVYGVAARTGPTDASTGVAAVIVDDFADVPNSGRYVTHKSLAVAAGATTRGHTTSVSEAAAFVMTEILTGGTLTENGAAPPVAATTSATAVTTAGFTPVPGSLLVALVSSDGGGGVTTMTVADTTGLSWMEQAKRNDAGHGYAGIWLAKVPGVAASTPAVTAGDSSAATVTDPRDGTPGVGAGAASVTAFLLDQAGSIIVDQAGGVMA